MLLNNDSGMVASGIGSCAIGFAPGWKPSDAASIASESLHKGHSLCLLTSKLRSFGEKVNSGVSDQQKRLFA